MKLYTIIDRSSGKMFSSHIPAENDLVALFGFCRWLKNEEAKNGMDKRNYALFSVAEFIENGKILSSDYHKIVNGDLADDMYNVELQKALEEEERSNE